ncbi:hypothetical protein B6U91_00435 [Candidatus Pacearchaeota archaeon ex4484_71]|nr:MAG: hypothetical protein B6U91_00435 [Candidatus Pacearchaeota archaeon ex4484_71]
MKAKFTKKVLENGVTVIFEKRNLPVVSILIGVRRGSNTEELSEKGISHFIEHLLYKGTKTRTSNQIAEEIEKNGGELNGFTSEEMVGYWCKMPSRNYEIGFDVLMDMVKNPLFSEEEIEKERRVIFEEMKLYRDNPSSYAFDKIHECLYEGTMSKGILGSESTLQKISKGDILKKFQETYVSENLVVVVVGDADEDYVFSKVKDEFGRKSASDDFKEIKRKNEKRIETRKGIDQAVLIFAYHVPIAEDPGSKVAKVLTTTMAEGMSSRLFRQIREKRNLAYAIRGYSQIGKYFAHNIIYVGTKRENVEEVEKLILEEFKKVAEGFEDEELKKIKDQMIGNYQISLEDSQSQVENLFVSEVHTRAEDFYEFEKEIESVNKEDVRKMASLVREGGYSLFALVPSKE